MARIRIIFEKKGWAIFLNHLDLPVLFSRAARRAGLAQEYTQGFSPHPRISLGPALAAGVEGFEEPADFWFDEWKNGDTAAWNSMLPEGIRILAHAEVDGPALSKLATAAVYSIKGANFVLGSEGSEILKKEVERTGILYDAVNSDGTVNLTVGDLEHCGAAGLVRSLKEAGICGGWKDLVVARRSVGAWDAERRAVLPLV